MREIPGPQREGNPSANVIDVEVAAMRRDLLRRHGAANVAEAEELADVARLAVLALVARDVVTMTTTTWDVIAGADPALDPAFYGAADEVSVRTEVIFLSAWEALRTSKARTRAEGAELVAALDRDARAAGRSLQLFVRDAADAVAVPPVRPEGRALFSTPAEEQAGALAAYRTRAACQAIGRWPADAPRIDREEQRRGERPELWSELIALAPELEGPLAMFLWAAWRFGLRHLPGEGDVSPEHSLYAAFQAFLLSCERRRLDPPGLARAVLKALGYDPAKFTEKQRADAHKANLRRRFARSRSPANND